MFTHKEGVVVEEVCLTLKCPFIYSKSGFDRRKDSSFYGTWQKTGSGRGSGFGREGKAEP